MGGRAVLMIEQGGRGGVADYTTQLARALGHRGWSVEVATAADHRYPAAAGVRPLPCFRYVRAGTPLRDLLRRSRTSRVLNGLTYLAAVPRMARAARRAGLAHLQGGEWLPLDLVLVLALAALRVPLVHTPHNVFDRVGDTSRARRAVWGVARAIVVHARADVPAVPCEVRDKVVVIPHGEYGALARTGGAADPVAAREALGVGGDDPVALLFGQLRPDKGLGDLLLAAEEVPGLRVLVAGQELGALAAERSRLTALDGRVVVREGHQSMDEVARLFAAADVVVLPYRRASQSGVLLLAYGFGRPVVVYPVGGLPEAVRDGETGWVCAAPEPSSLAATLGAVAAAGRAECARRGVQGARLAATEFSWDVIAARTEEVYERARAAA